MNLNTELKKAYKTYMKEYDYDHAYDCVMHLYNEFKDYDTVRNFRGVIGRKFARSKKPHDADLGRMTYFLTAKDVFDDYMVAMEWERPFKEKFYLPRREMLVPIVHEMQRLVDDELDLLGVSAPPGIGKTALGDFFMTFNGGRNPELSMLMGSHSNGILNDNYNECIRMMSSSEYCWKEIFPGHSVKKTNAADLKIDVDVQRKFSTFSFSSVGSSLAGKVRAMGLLYLDDLVPGIEVAMSRERLDKLWQSYTTDFRQRKQGRCKELHISTRWSVHDILGRLESDHEGDPRAKFLRLSALDENDESNFDYGGDIGFSTKYYHDMRSTMDEASWKAIFMNEPIEREGLLYDLKELRTYFDLPSDEPDAILSVCDTKDQGADDLVMPIAYQYGNDFYIEEIICDNSTPDITTPRVINALLRHKVKLSRFESNSAGGMIAKQVQEGVNNSGGITKITTKYSTSNKETRIIVDSAWVKEHCLFKDKDNWTQEYRKAMNNLTGYSLMGKNKHDDVPDAFSMLANFVQSFETNVITIKRRYF